MRSLVPTAYLPSFFQSLHDYVVDPSMPLYARSLGCSDSQVGVIVAGMLIGATFFNIPAGAATSRFGSHAVLPLSMLVCAAAAGAMLAARDFYGLLAAQVAAGLGASLFNVGVSALLCDRCPGRFRGRVTSVKGGLGRIAMMLGTAVGGLVAARYGLAAPIVLRGLLPLLSLLLYLTLPRCTRRPQRRGGPASAVAASIYRRGRGPDAEPALGTCAVARLKRREICTAGYVAFSIMGVRNARRIVLPLAGARVGLGVAEVGAAMSLMGLADSVCFPAVGVLSDRYGRKFTGVPAYGMLALGFSVLGGLDASSGGLTLTLAALTVGIGNGMSSGIISMMGGDCSPPAPNSGRFMGIWAVLDDCGGALGPLLVGVLAQEASVFFAASAVAAWALASTVFFWLCVRETHRERARPLGCCR
jgi:MFS family permease